MAWRPALPGLRRSWQTGPRRLPRTALRRRTKTRPRSRGDGMKIDSFTKIVLVAIAILLGMLVFRPIVQPAPVRAQSSEGYPFYVEPGFTTLRKPDGTAQMY